MAKRRTITMRLASAAAVALALSACNVHSLYGPGKTLEDEIKAGNWQGAAEIYAAEEAYFKEKGEAFAPQLAAIAAGLNAELEPPMDRAIAQIDAVDWPLPREEWNQVKGLLKTGDNLLKAYDSYPVLQAPELRSNRVTQLSTAMVLLNGKMKESAAEAFVAYDHFAGQSFFDAYPLNMQPSRFMTAHYETIKSEVDQANTLELGRFLNSYRMGKVLQGEVGSHVRETYIDALTMERTGGRPASLADSWEVLSEAKEKGIDVKRIARDRFAVMEVPSRPRIGESGIGFPIRMDSDLAFGVHKVGLEKSLSDEAASKADYLIVVDLAASEAEMNQTQRSKVASRYYTHSIYSINPAYTAAQTELQSAQFNLQQAMMNQQQAMSNTNYGNSREAALAGVFATVLNSAVSASAVSDAEERVAQAQAKLNETPSQLEHKQYAPYEFTRLTNEATKTYAVNYFVVDRRTNGYVKGTLHLKDAMTFQVLDGVRQTDPELEKHQKGTTDKATMQSWLKSESVVKVSDIVNDYKLRKKSAEDLPALALVQRDMFDQRNAMMARLKTKKPTAPQMVAVVEKTVKTTKLGFGREAVYKFPAGEKQPNGYAVVIGVKSYENADVPDVDYAHNDADAIRQYLIKTRGFSKDNVVVLSDPGQSKLSSYFGTETNPEGRLFDIVKREKLEEVFVYFSGHGVPTADGTGVLMPSDADPLKPGLTGYKLETLVRNLNKLEGVQVTLAVDSCFSGVSHGGTLVKAASPVFLAARPEKAGLKNGVVFTAADGREIASWDERMRLGLFTRHLLEALLGRADSVAGNDNGKVEVFEVESYLKTYVGREANRLYSRQQTPQTVGNPSAVVAEQTDPDFEKLENILALSE